MGSAKAAWSPSVVATSAFANRGSRVTSAIHTGARLAHTSPTSPSPRANVISSPPASRIAASVSGEADHMPRIRITAVPGSRVHTAPMCVPRASHTAWASPAAASSRFVASASTRATACSARVRRSARARSEVSRKTTVTPEIRLPSRTGVAARLAVRESRARPRAGPRF